MFRQDKIIKIKRESIVVTTWCCLHEKMPSDVLIAPRPRLIKPSPPKPTAFQSALHMRHPGPRTQSGLNVTALQNNCIHGCMCTRPPGSGLASIGVAPYLTFMSG